VSWKGYGHDDQNGNRVIDYSDGKRNLDVQPEYAFFPEQNEPDAYKASDGSLVSDATDSELHNKVDVQVTISPPIPQGITTADLDLFKRDPDNSLADGGLGTEFDGDPDTFTDQLEKPGDNYGSFYFAEQIAFDPGESAAEATLTIPQSRKPGDNHIVFVHSDSNDSGIDVDFVEGDADKLRYRLTTEGSGGSGGTSISYPEVPTNLRTPTLTVWRTLWIEADSMGDPDAPDAIGRGTFEGENGDVDGDENFDPHDPPTNLLPNSLLPAKVRVKTLPSTYDSIHEIPFRHNMPSLNAVNIGTDARNVEAEKDYWTVHLVGAYEHQDNLDYDGEADWLGGHAFNFPGGGPLFIYQETTRDVAETPHPYANGTRLQVQERVVLHEVLHCFLGAHAESGSPPSPFGADEGIMDPLNALSGQDISLTRRQLRYIQSGQYSP